MNQLIIFYAQANFYLIGEHSSVHALICFFSLESIHFCSLFYCSELVVKLYSKMSTTVQRTPKSGRQSLFFNDLATPISSRRGKFSTSGQAAAVSALWRENFASSDLPPPPVFTLEDRSDYSPESGIMDYPMSPEAKSDPRTPVQNSGREFSTPLNSKSEASTSMGLTASQQNQQGSLSLNWWSPGKSTGDQEEKGKGSPVEGVVQPGALITVPQPREVARPEMQRSSLPAGNLNEEEWVTVYGCIHFVYYYENDAY